MTNSMYWLHKLSCKFGTAILVAVVSAFGATARAAVPEVHPDVLKAEQRRIDTIRRIMPTVIAVFDIGGHGGGSGVLISEEGFALTNFHVAATGPALKCGLPDGKIYDAVIVGIDPVGDLALIKLLGDTSFPCAELGDSDQVRPGDAAIVIGNPFMLATDLQPTVTWGMISGVHRYQYPAGTLLEYADCIQTDAAINPGNSGGPLFDAAGKLIGINGRAQFEKRGRVNVGVGFAISINQVKNFLYLLHAGRIVDHATLGATVGYDNARRVVVTNILENCDAYRRGLRIGDEIVSLAGRPVTSPNDFKNILGTLPKGWRVPLSFRRAGQRFDCFVRLQGVHAEGELIQLLEKAKREGPEVPPRPNRQPNQPQDHNDDSPPAPRLDRLPEPPLPEIVKKHYEEKRGFANYFFNRLHQDRVYSAWHRTFTAPVEGQWELSIRLPGGAKFKLTLDDEQALLQSDGQQLRYVATDPVAEALVPPATGGLLPALYCWRRLAVVGPEQFGQLYYWGRAPLLDLPYLADVLVGIYGGAECRFYFDPQSGHLLAMELFGDPLGDPCELYFTDYQKLGNGLWPQQIQLRYGDTVFTIITVESLQIVAKR